MSKIFKIECPKCGEEFDAGSAFNSHVENAKKQQEAQINEQAEKKFKSQLDLIKKLKKRKKMQRRRHNKRLKKNLKPSYNRKKRK